MAGDRNIEILSHGSRGESGTVEYQELIVDGHRITPIPGVVYQILLIDEDVIVLWDDKKKADMRNVARFRMDGTRAWTIPLPPNAGFGYNSIVKSDSGYRIYTVNAEYALDVSTGEVKWLAHYR